MLKVTKVTDSEHRTLLALRLCFAAVKAISNTALAGQTEWSMIFTRKQYNGLMIFCAGIFYVLFSSILSTPFFHLEYSDRQLDILAVPAGFEPASQP